MALNINIVNSTIIEVYQDSNYPRYYFGALGTSGKFYPSGTSGSVNNFEILSNTIQNAVDGSYTSIPYQSSNINGFAGNINIIISGGAVTDFYIEDTNGFALGDTITIQGFDFGGEGYLTSKINSLVIDGLLIVIGGDDYEVKWNNLVVGGTSPTSLSDAQSLLSNLFSTL